MNISKVLSHSKIIVEFSNKSKKEIIDELIDKLEGDERVTDIDQIRSAVHEREQIMSTGVGKGFAIPHAKTRGVNDIVAAFGRISESVDFEALDGKPVKLVLLLVGPETMVSQHIKLLSRISRMINNNDFLSALLNAESAEEILKIITDEEEKLVD